MIEIILISLISQFLLIPRISERLYYRKYSFSNDYLCNLMNTTDENKKSKILYQSSAILFSFAYFGFLFIFPAELQIYCLIFFIFFSLQAIIHGQDSKPRLAYHCYFLLISFIDILILSFIVYEKSDSIIIMICSLILCINILLIIKNLIYNYGKKDKIEILWGKISYISLIVLTLQFLLIYSF